MNPLFKQLQSCGLIPVIKIQDPSTAVPLMQALRSGGIRVAEVTFRTSHAPAAIADIAAAFPDVLVGAGTVLTRAHVDQAIEAGARFAVTPGFHPDLVRYCQDRGLPVIPGVSTAGEIAQAMDLGLICLKFFPAEQSGGTAFLKAMSGPYSEMKFIPTGGIHVGNLHQYLALSNVLACGGSWMVRDDLIASGDYQTISELSAEAVRDLLGLELDHIGLPCSQNAEAAAGEFARLLGVSPVAVEASFLAGKRIRCLCDPEAKRGGYLALRCRRLACAEAQLTARGFSLDETTRQLDPAGNTTSIFLQHPIAGFRIQLLA